MASSLTNKPCYHRDFTYKSRTYTVSITCNSGTSISKADSTSMRRKRSSESSSLDFSSEIHDTIRAMMNQEIGTYYKPGKIESCKEDPYRKVMVEWICTLVDVFELPNHIASVAVYYLDASVSKDLATSPDEYKLLSITALQLAIKVYDYQIFPLQRLLFFSNAGFNVQQVYQMESRVMDALHWSLHPPTYECFLNYYCKILSTCGKVPMPTNLVDRIDHKARELLRVTLTTHTFRPYRPSVITYATIVLSMNHLLRGDLENYRHEFVRQVSGLIICKGIAKEKLISELSSYFDSTGRMMDPPPENNSNECSSSSIMTSEAPLDSANTVSHYPVESKEQEQSGVLSPCNVVESL